MANRIHVAIAAGLLALVVTPALAIQFPEPAPRAHWECVPFARAISGVAIYGDAHTWWDQAEGRYKRGARPTVGAVMAFQPHNGMLLGHVAVVSGIIDARTITVSHANWSPINGTRGQIERNVAVRDVSERGDWSAVRVWFAPLCDLGSTAWPVHGFIYPGAAPLQQGAPKLLYAGLSALDGDSRPARGGGKLAYLAKLLPTLH